VRSKSKRKGMRTTISALAATHIQTSKQTMKSEKTSTLNHSNSKEKEEKEKKKEEKTKEEAEGWEESCRWIHQV